jgi:FkbM family methyltransferase
MSDIATVQTPGQLPRLIDAAFTCGRILRSGLYGSRGLSVVSSYARLKLAAIVGGGAKRQARQTTRVGGWRVSYWGKRALALMFGAKFIKLEYFFSTSASRPRIVDCGANIGIAILFFKTLYPDCEIVAFEPNSQTFEALSDNVRDNNLSGVTLHHCAVGASDGTATFYAEPDDPGSALSSLFVERGRTPSEVVHIVRLSSYITAPVDFLKIDVEGAELDVLRELHAAGKLAMVREMVIEYHHHIRSTDDNMSVLLGVLENAGFGYQLQLPEDKTFGRGVFQDVLVYAYAKNQSPTQPI